ncbi:MAG: energy transducer TonB [Gammaproteobacteria bacterium]
MKDMLYYPKTRYWLLAALVAAGFHLSIIGLIFWEPVQASSGQAKAQGEGGIEISLGSAGRSTGNDLKKITEPKPIKKEKVVEKDKLKSKIPNKKTVKPAERRPEQKPEIKEMTAPGDKGLSGTTEENDRGSGNSTAGGGMVGTSPSYIVTLQSWLERHKQYPRRARARQQQGTVLLYFVVSRTGQVINYKIQQSSGYAMLDDEVLAMIQRAQPLPAFPESIPVNQMQLEVPVQFYIY